MFPKQTKIIITHPNTYTLVSLSMLPEILPNAFHVRPDWQKCECAPIMYQPLPWDPGYIGSSDGNIYDSFFFFLV